MPSRAKRQKTLRGMLPHDRHTTGTTQSPPSPLESVIATYTNSQSRGTTTNAGLPSHDRPTYGLDLYTDTAINSFVAPDPTGSSLAKLTLKGIKKASALTLAAIDSRPRVDNHHARFQCPAMSCRRISPPDESYIDFAKHVSIHASESFSHQLNVCKFGCPVSFFDMVQHRAHACSCP